MKFNRNRLKSIYTHEISIYLHRHRTKKPFAQHIYSFRKISIQNACIYIYILYTIVPPEAKSHTLLKSNPDSIIYSKTIDGPRNPPMHPLFQPSAVSLPEKSQKHAVPQHPLNRAYILPHTHTRDLAKKPRPLSSGQPWQTDAAAIDRYLRLPCSSMQRRNERKRIEFKKRQKKGPRERRDRERLHFPSSR